MRAEVRLILWVYPRVDDRLNDSVWWNVTGIGPFLNPLRSLSEAVVLEDLNKALRSGIVG